MIESVEDDLKHHGAITVAELIMQLSILPQDKLVQSEGCDCYGACDGAAEYDEFVLVKRSINDGR